MAQRFDGGKSVALLLSSAMPASKKQGSAFMARNHAITGLCNAGNEF
jgi:hypothetical protein